MRALPALPAAVAVSAALAAACAPAASPARWAAHLPAPSASGGAAEWVPLPHHLQPELRRDRADGSTELLHGGVRVRVTGDGALERGAEPLPPSAPVRVVPLAEGPDAPLLLEVRGPGSTELLRSVGWTGGLRSLRLLDGRLDQPPVVGLGRIWVKERGLLRAFALETGEPAAPDGVPPAAGHAQLAFGGPGLGVFVDPWRGLLTTVDAGASWRTHGGWPTATRGTPAGVELDLGGRRLRLGVDGELTELDAAPGASEPTHGAGASPPHGAGASPAPGAEPPPPVRREGARRLELAVLRGHPDGPGAALIIDQERLLRVRLADGRVLDAAPAPGRAADDCVGLALGRGVGFACSGARGRSALLAVTEPLGLRAALEFDDPRAFVPSGNGGVVIRGGCAPRAVPRRACIRAPAGEVTDLALTGRPGRERLVALRRGVAAVLAPEGGAPAERVVFLPGAPPRRTPLRLPPPGPEGLDARAATWLEGWHEVEGGALRGWLLEGERLASATIAPDGRVTLGPGVTGSVAVVGGAHALMRHSLATGSFTRDFGRTWSSESLAQPAATRAVEGPAPLRGCTAVGCAIDGWVRLWTGATTAAIARPPAPAAFSGGWFGAETPAPLRCEVTSLAPRGATGAGAARGGAPARSDDAWLDVPGVPAGGASLRHGTDAGTTPVRGAVWGREGALSWGLRVAEELAPFTTWITRPTAAPWDTIEEAGARFGQAVGAAPAVWRATLEPTLPAAALLIRRQGQGEVMLLAEGRAPIVLRGIGPGEEPAGLVRVHGVYHLGLLGTGFRVVRVLGGAVETVLSRTVERADGASQGLAVVRDVAGRRLGLVTRSALHPGRSPGLVYPVDPDSGAIGAPEVLPPPGGALAACPADAAGWVVRGAAPTRLGLFGADGDPLAVRRVTARWVWTAEGACLDALGAWRDHGAPPPSPPSPGRGGAASPASPPSRGPGVPLALRDAGGPLSELRCRAR